MSMLRLASTFGGNRQSEAWHVRVVSGGYAKLREGEKHKLEVRTLPNPKTFTRMYLYHATARGPQHSTYIREYANKNEVSSKTSAGQANF